MKYIVGVDTGLHGAIAKLDMDMNFVSAIEIPTMLEVRGTKKTKKRSYDIPRIVEYFNSLDVDDHFFIIEQTNPMSSHIGGHPATNYFLGGGFFLMVGAIAMRGFKYDLVRPKAWQKTFFKPASGQTKTLSYQTASRLFPKATLVTPRGRVLDGHADALLIAEFGRRKLIGITETHIT